ncbi:MAG: hypothetical protein CMJ82_03735 [Planctomycetaceae bacterium]|nr:hypothetical protein [Planctomycetaceae bacterium]
MAQPAGILAIGLVMQPPCQFLVAQARLTIYICGTSKNEQNTGPNLENAETSSVSLSPALPF